VTGYFSFSGIDANKAKNNSPGLFAPLSDLPVQMLPGDTADENAVRRFQVQPELIQQR